MPTLGKLGIADYAESNQEVALCGKLPGLQVSVRLHPPHFAALVRKNAVVKGVAPNVIAGPFKTRMFYFFSEGCKVVICPKRGYIVPCFLWHI